MKISVLIPTKNEPLIDELVKKIHDVLEEYDHEIMVIDKSDVPPKISGAKLVLQKSDGLGKAVLEGLSHASGDSVVLMDGDFSHRPEDLPRLIRASKKADIVIGSRFIPGGKNLDEGHRKIISKFFRGLASLTLGIDIIDNMSGFSVIKRKVYDKLELNPLGYKINVEILYKGKKFGFKSLEVPITFVKRKKGKSKAGIKEGLKTLIFILKLRLGI